MNDEQFVDILKTLFQSYDISDNDHENCLSKEILGKSFEELADNQLKHLFHCDRCMKIHASVRLPDTALYSVQNYDINPLKRKLMKRYDRHTRLERIQEFLRSKHLSPSQIFQAPVAVLRKAPATAEMETAVLDVINLSGLPLSEENLTVKRFPSGRLSLFGFPENFKRHSVFLIILPGAHIRKKFPELNHENSEAILNEIFKKDSLEDILDCPFWTRDAQIKRLHESFGCEWELNAALAAALLDILNFSALIVF